MGFLKIFGRPLSFDESKEYFEFIREGAVETIIDLINSNKAKKCHPKFGYEVELHKITVDHQNKKVLLDLTGQDTINKYHDIEEVKGEVLPEYTVHFEYGRWMIEAVPRYPLRFDQGCFFETSMKGLYNYITQITGDNKVLSVSAFPKLGDKSEGTFYILNETSSPDNFNNSLSEQEEFISKAELVKNPFSESQYIDDLIINTHPRFGTLTRNIRSRRGSKVDIRIPIFIDENTNLDSEPFPGFIHMDAMAFGMGSCCLQVTIGTCSLNSACLQYDQFIPLSPILLALTSSGPIYKGKLSAYDNRFDVISQSVDDRTEEERNPNSPFYICKSRYSPAYSYISEHVYVQDFHNDNNKFNINEAYLQKMIESGLPKRLSQHFCNLLSRDPLVIFENKIKLSDKSDRSHFENFNSTNWNSVRFKPPREEDNDECFKVEIRPCELQLTPFENSAIIGMVISLYLSIFTYDVNFILPISKVDENMRRAYQMDAIKNQKFFWRVNGIDQEYKIIREYFCKSGFVSPHDKISSSCSNLEEDEKNIKELTIAEILLGSSEYNYPGLIKLCKKAIEFNYKDSETINKFSIYFDFLEKRAKGEFWTDAKYIRNFVLQHPLYKKDSIVTDEIQYDLINHLLKIQQGDLSPEMLFGKLE